MEVENKGGTKKVYLPAMRGHYQHWNIHWPHKMEWQYLLPGQTSAKEWIDERRNKDKDEHEEEEEEEEEDDEEEAEEEDDDEEYFPHAPG
jgi:hypothetical protein